MFYTKKEGSKYFILGKMSSGSQKNIQYKKEGGVHKKEGRIQGPVQAIGQARLYKRAACTYNPFF